jgi:hypothetical protein
MRSRFGLSKPKKYTPATKATVTTLARRINRVSRMAKRGSTAIQMYKVITSTNLLSNFNYFSIMDYINYTPIFGASGLDFNNANKITHKKTTMDFLFDYGNETDNIDITCFLVQLKALANNAYDKTNGILSMTNGQEYIIPSSALSNLVTLNPKMFNVLKTKRFRLGNNGVAIGTSTAQGINSTAKKFKWVLNVNKIIGSATGNVQQQYASQSPTNQYYVLIFNNIFHLSLINYSTKE